MGDETRVQMREAKKGAEAIGNILERYLVRILGPLGRRIQTATPTGRILALSGVVVAIISIVIILFTSLKFDIAQPRWLTVKKKTVNVRSKPSVRGKIVTKVYKGRKVKRLTSTKNWHKVRTRGKTGWIAKTMVGGNRSLIMVYEMKGFGILFLVGIGLFVAGILQRRS